MNGLATTSVYWNRGAARMIRPPRALITGLGKGRALGEPGDAAGQERVLTRALDLLRLEAPVEESL